VRGWIGGWAGISFGLGRWWGWLLFLLLLCSCGCIQPLADYLANH
jgi:hypothetical protein